MCPPKYFGVEYVINPWMEGQLHAVDVNVAFAQWSQLQMLLSEHATVAFLPPVPGLPDLVFTANAALIYSNTAVLSSFRYPERQPESKHFANWLAADGFRVRTLPPNVLFEGAGDALLDRKDPLLWFGHGLRSDISAKQYLEEATGLEVQALRLQDPSFYHLDTCFCPLEHGYVMYYPAAFDQQSQQAIEDRVPANRRILLSASDARQFAGNTVNIGNTIILNGAGPELTNRLNACGFQVKVTPLTQFLRAGGAAKCLSLRLDEFGR
jgi:N-dimethylarginine dimethylaminohydrolase